MKNSTMQKLLLATLCALLFAGCTGKDNKGKFTVNGEIKNLPDQKIYLEQLYFSSQKNPEVLDTAVVKNGKFTITATAPEQGLFRLRLEKDKGYFVFINDQPTLIFSADFKNLNMKSVTVSSPANMMMKNFITETDSQLSWFYNKGTEINRHQQEAGTDSLFNVMVEEFNSKLGNYHQYLIRYIDTVSSPVMALFAVGYTNKIDPNKLQPSVNGLQKRFPGNSAVSAMVNEFNQMLAAAKQQKLSRESIPGPGTAAPEITMPDTDGNNFSLSSLRGKYVLVDFWASWCGPCRAENPNVVAAYNKYKDKNFTVLGVSLDKSKEAWLKAIADDKLTWKHISDLKQWGSAAVELYRFEGIPYNVLLDPQGKIIATSLRGADLETKLAEVLK